MLVADGAMGSMLFEAAGAQRCFEELNVTQPEAVFRVHQAYIEAGAQIIETNTFGANRSKLAPLGLAEQVPAFNHRGVKIAREAREARRPRSADRRLDRPAGRRRRTFANCRARRSSRSTASRRRRSKSAAWIFSFWRRFPSLDLLLAAIDAIRSFLGAARSSRR